MYLLHETKKEISAINFNIESLEDLCVHRSQAMDLSSDVQCSCDVQIHSKPSKRIVKHSRISQAGGKLKQIQLCGHGPLRKRCSLGEPQSAGSSGLASEQSQGARPLDRQVAVLSGIWNHNLCFQLYSPVV
jgi:hypothetical protein